MRKIFLSFLAISMAMMSVNVEAKKLHTIGDSTMDQYTPQSVKQGWGSRIQQFFNGKDTSSAGITVNNRAKSGSDTRTFYEGSAYWPTLKAGAGAMQAGDLLLIQFAHNDEGTGTNGMDNLEYKALRQQLGLPAYTDNRGTNPRTTYRDMLRLYIDEARAMGVKPILVGAICRKYFNGNTIKRNGRHDLGDKYLDINDVQFDAAGEPTAASYHKLPATDRSMDYTYAMQQVAREKGVPFIDLTSATEAMYLRLGENYCTNNIFTCGTPEKGDNTHTNGLGATLIAREFAKLVRDSAQANPADAVLAELAQYLTIDADINLTPSSTDMGSIYVGQSVTKQISIAGFDLVPATGTYSLVVNECFEVSLDGENFSQSLTGIAYTGGNIFQDVYVKGAPVAEGIANGTLTLTCGSITRSATLTIEGIINTSGEETVLEPTVAYSNMVAGTPATGTIGQEEFNRYTTASNSWPTNEEDEVADRYIEYTATIPAGKNFRFDRLSVRVAAMGSSDMRLRVYYSTEADYANPVQVKEFAGMGLDTPYDVACMPMRELTEGDQITIRIYPWMQQIATAQTDKYVGVKDLTIHGYLEDIPTTEEKTTIWDFQEFTTQVNLNSDLNYSGEPKYAKEYTKDDMTILLVGTETGLDSKGNVAEYVNSTYGFHCNGASKTNTRHIRFTPAYDGHWTVSYRSNNSSDTTRIVAIGTAVTTFNPIPETLPATVLAAGYTVGTQTIEVDLTAGTTYYAYFAFGGSSITRLQYDYSKPVSPTAVEEQKVSKGEKVMRGGKILILRGEYIYDLMGRRVR